MSAPGSHPVVASSAGSKEAPELPSLGELSVAQALERVASRDPTPGAGPSLAWACGLAAALVEMVSAVSQGQEPADPGAVAQRRERARALREQALALADADAAAYREVLAVQRRPQDPDYPGRLRQALHAAADPLVAIVQAAGEVAALAAEATNQVRGGARGEAITAALLGEAVTDAGVKLVALNLAGARDDPRLAQVRQVAESARRARGRAVGS